MDHDFLCELCVCDVHDGDQQVRITSDSGGLPSGADLYILAVFHLKCLQETMDQTDCDEVDYIDEARRQAKAVEPRRWQTFATTSAPELVLN